MPATVLRNLKLDQTEQTEFQAMMEQPEFKEAVDTDLTWADELMLKGEERGEKKGLLRSVRRLWSMRFGPLPAELEQRLEALEDLERIDAVLEVIAGAKDQAGAHASVLALCGPA